MKWSELLQLIGDRPILESSMLLAGEESPAEVRRQLSRWVKAGKLHQIRRGLYVLAPPWAKTAANPLALAARLVVPSYVSLQSALAYHGLIPESVPVVTSITTRRPGRFETDLGTFTYRHIHRNLFWGYEQVIVDTDQPAYMAKPEKALLDLVHLTPGPIDASFLRELRLSWSDIDSHQVKTMARRTERPKLIRAAKLLVQERHEQTRGVVSL